MSGSVAIFLVLIPLALCTSTSPRLSPSPSALYSIANERFQNIEPRQTVSYQGWTSPPSGRGTIDIIWSCVFTIFLCSWSVLCVNVPSPNDAWWKTLWRKLALAGLGVLGPEFTLQIALGQWISAQRSVTAFEASARPDWPEWSMKHAFFADMGGFVLQPVDWVPFPVDAKQIHYLLSHGYIEFPTITKDQIEDRNKVDSLLRALTVLQVLWFVMNCVARWLQHLDVTTFELTTLGFIFCTLGTYACWAHKPADVEVSEILHCKVSLCDILTEAGDSARPPYSKTPLDFISRKEWSWSLWWSFILNVLAKLHIRFQPQVRPIDRFPNDSWLEIPTMGIFALGCVDMTYAAIYVAGWNFYFPTPIERTLWHMSTLTILAIVASYLVIETYAFHVHPRLPQAFQNLFKRKHSKTSSRARTWVSGATPSRIHKAAAWMRNNSPNHDPRMDIPLKASIPITVTGLIYAIARVYILTECWVVLRRMPSSAYQTVDWTRFFPHV